MTPSFSISFLKGIMDWVIVNYQMYGETFTVCESEITKRRGRLKRVFKHVKPWLPMILGFLLR